MSDLFHPEITLLRVKLRDYSLKLWHSDPPRNGVQAAEVYWKKGVYDTLTVARNIKKGWTPVEKAYVRSHLVNSVGHFHHLLALIDEIGSAKKRKRTLTAVDFCFQRPYGNNAVQHRKGLLINH